MAFRLYNLPFYRRVNWSVSVLFKAKLAWVQLWVPFVYCFKSITEFLEIVTFCDSLEIEVFLLFLLFIAVLMLSELKAIWVWVDRCFIPLWKHYLFFQEHTTIWNGKKIVVYEVSQNKSFIRASGNLTSIGFCIIIALPQIGHTLSTKSHQIVRHRRGLTSFGTLVFIQVTEKREWLSAPIIFVYRGSDQVFFERSHCRTITSKLKKHCSLLSNRDDFTYESGFASINADCGRNFGRTTKK